MIVTDHFVFVHLPRCGGTFVTDVIRKFFPSAHETGHHLPLRLLPTRYSGLPILGTVRNPWDFYVSLYHYLIPRQAETILASWMSDNGRLDITTSIRNLLNLGCDKARLDRLAEMLPNHMDYSKRQIPNVDKETVRNLEGSGVGYYTFRFNEMFGNPDELFLCRVERLRQDLVKFFEGIGSITDEIRDYVLSLEGKNSSEHRHYSSYYTPELSQLVFERDHLLIQRFGYTFEVPSDAKAPRTELTRSV
jgi:hypothetical protein